VPDVTNETPGVSLNAALADDVIVMYPSGVIVPPMFCGRRAASDTVGMPVGGVVLSVAVSVAVADVVAGIVSVADIPDDSVPNVVVAGPLLFTESVFVELVVGAAVGGVPEPEPLPPPPHAVRLNPATIPKAANRVKPTEILTETSA
jgi:hypothetical protein